MQSVFTVHKHPLEIVLLSIPLANKKARGVSQKNCKNVAAATVQAPRSHWASRGYSPSTFFKDSPQSYCKYGIFN